MLHAGYSGITFHCRLHGSYEALNSGSLCDAMVDFTGGLMEIYELDKAPPNLFKIMHNAYLHSSFMGCSITVSVMSLVIEPVLHVH